MSEANELEKLEGFVSTLLERFNALQKTNQELNEELERRNARVEQLEDDIASMKDERGEISSRVSTIIGKIEEWESATAGEAEPEGDGGESEAAPESEVEEEKKEAGVQGNLFTVEATGQ